MATRTDHCEEDLRDPKLPCVLLVCRTCLESNCRDKRPGDEVPCPVCRNEFQVHEDRVADLPVRTRDQEPASSARCEACSPDQRNINPRPATDYDKGFVKFSFSTLKFTLSVSLVYFNTKDKLCALLLTQIVQANLL